MSKRQRYGEVIRRIRERERCRNQRLIAEIRAELAYLDSRASISLRTAEFLVGAWNWLARRRQ